MTPIDWTASSCYTPPWYYQAMVYADIMRAAELMHRSQTNRPFVPDALVCTEALASKIAESAGFDVVPTQACGLPVLTQATDLGCDFRALMLAQEGKRVLICRDDGTTKEVSYSS